MKPKSLIWIFSLHLILLFLAATRLTAISWIWGNASWTWDYFQYAYRNGWGFEYRSEYPLLVVTLYILAYSLGTAGYLFGRNHLNPFVIATGTFLCGVGTLSFVIEGSHWAWNHHLSLIFSCPVASLVLGGVAIFKPSVEPEFDPQ